MSLELRDLRAKVDVETDCWLTAMARSTNRDKGAIVREILHEHASQHLRASKIAARLLEVEGIAGNRGEGAA